MADHSTALPVPARAGLCARCEYARAIANDRGSVFVLCGRSRLDPAYRRYPALPVIACAGFEVADAGRDGPDAVGDPRPA